MITPSNSASTLGYYQRFLRGMKRGELFFLQATGIISALLNMLGVSVLVPFVAIVLSGDTSTITTFSARWLPRELQELVAGDPVLYFGLGILGIFLCKHLVAIAAIGFHSNITENYTAQIRLAVNEKVMRNPAAFGLENEKARAIHINSLLPQLSSLNYALVECNTKLYILAGLAVLLVALSFQLTLLLVGVVSSIILLGLPVFRWTRSTSASFYGYLGRVQDLAIATTEGAETIKTLHVVDRQLERFRAANAKLKSFAFSLSLSRQTIFSLPEISLVVVTVGALVLFRPTQSAAVFYGTFLFSLIRLISALNDFVTRFNSALELSGLGKEVYGYLEENVALPRSQERTAAGERFSRPLQRIRCENLLVCHQQRQILGPLTWEFSRGKRISIAGGNGSGKSTLVRSILGLVAFEGRILVNGMNLRSISDADFYQSISYFSQAHFLFEATIAENILLAAPGKSIREVERLMADVGIDLPAARFPQGLASPIAANGKNLSGGERQYICLLRALLRDADLYIFDEPSNHLDAQINAKFLRYMERKLESALLISHQAIPFCDETIRLEGGRMVSEQAARLM